MVTEPGGGQPVPYGPVNEASRGGLVKYKLRGLGVHHRKRNAYKQMYDACGGYYRIDAEGPGSEGSRVVDDGLGGLDVQSREYWYVQFSCVPAPPLTPDPRANDRPPAPLGSPPSGQTYPQPSTPAYPPAGYPPDPGSPSQGGAPPAPAPPARQAPP